jgi:hypothetical protein
VVFLLWRDVLFLGLGVGRQLVGDVGYVLLEVLLVVAIVAAGLQGELFGLLQEGWTGGVGVLL